MQHKKQKVVKFVSILILLFFLSLIGLVIFFGQKYNSKLTIQSIEDFKSAYNLYDTQIKRATEISKSKINVYATIDQSKKTNITATEIIVEADQKSLSYLDSIEKLKGNDLKRLKTEATEYQLTSTKLLSFLEDQISWDKNMSDILDRHHIIWEKIDTASKQNTLSGINIIKSEHKNLQKLKEDTKSYQEPARYQKAKSLFVDVLDIEDEYLKYALRVTNDSSVVDKYYSVVNVYASEMKKEYDYLDEELGNIKSKLLALNKSIELEVNQIINKNR